MSNPLKAKSTPLTKKQQELAELPTASISVAELYTGEFGRFDKMSDLKVVDGFCRQVGLGDALSVPLKASQTTDQRARNSKSGVVLAVSPSDGFRMRKRTYQGVHLALQGYKQLPQSGFMPFTQAGVGEATATRVYCTGNTVHSFGRLEMYLARDNQLGGRRLKPPTRAEAELSLKSSGLTAGCNYTPKELYAEEAEHALRINVSASNGLPVMGSFEGEAAVMVSALYERCLKELRGLASGLPRKQAVEAVVERVWNMGTDPETLPLVACLGKVKADMYKLDKVRAGQLRFYNVVPRQMAMIMMRATQTVEEQAESLLDSHDVHTFSGVTLNYGGADRLVAQLENQLALEGRAFAHMGDDSWVAVQVRSDDGPKLVMFALDCSSFDLTQHASVTEPIHEVLRDRLAEVDPVAAGVWFAYMRMRTVVTAKSVAKRWQHGGPSGTPMQSKVNGMLMDVAIRRVLQSIPGDWIPDEEHLAAILKDVGGRLGLVVKLEQYHVTACAAQRPIAQALRERPFLYVGYYFYNERGFVQVFCDLPRAMSGMLYPTRQWVGDKGQLEAQEAVRLGSIVLTMGVPPAACEKAHAAMRSGARRMIADVVAKGFKPEPERGESPWVMIEPSLKSIAQRLEDGGVERLWDMPGTLEVPPDADATAVRSLVRQVMNAQQLTRSMAAMRLVPREHGTASSESAHAPTRWNAGRPPPVTFWGPDKQPMEEVAVRVARKARKGGYKGGVYSDSDEEDDRFSLYDLD